MKNIYITVNGSTLFNIDSDFEKKYILEIYDITLRTLNKEHMLTYDAFKEGATIFALPLTNFDNMATIRNPYYGSLRITLSFNRTGDNAILLLIGDVLSSMSVNFKREITLNRN